MRHPDERQLALYAGEDCGWIERFSIRRHVARCRSCRSLAEAYKEDRESVRREAAQLPPEMDWDRVAAEMTANIRVGLEAGECVADSTRRPLRVSWRPAFAAVALATVLLAGWYLNFPVDQRMSLGRGIARLWNRQPARAAAGVSLETTRNGIQVSENGSALAMMNPTAAPQVVVVNTSGSLRASYVDDDTGQVTVTNVYAQ